MVDVLSALNLQKLCEDPGLSEIRELYGSQCYVRFYHFAFQVYHYDMGTCRRIEIGNMMSPLCLFFFVWMDYDFDVTVMRHEVCMRGCALTWGGVRRAGTWPLSVGETGTR